MPKSVMAHSFSQVPRANIPRSSFNRSHGYKTTFDADSLIPVLVDPVLPGDTYNVNMSFVSRFLSPTVVPLNDNLFLESFFFFVPNRLVWTNWEKFCGMQVDPGDSIDYTIPVLTGSTSDTGEGSLWDYFGLPLDDGAGGGHIDPDDTAVSALPHRAYALIWNEWFRDQNLQDTWVMAMDDGPQVFSSVQSTNHVPRLPLKRGKRHDYFTSCLPWPQKGDAVDLPLGTVAPVIGEGTATPTFDHGTGTSSLQYELTNNNVVTAGAGTDASALVWNDTALEADLTNATAATINQLRLAFQTQRLLERDARSGTRYNELILAHFGVTVPDFRIQRPEFLGGGSTAIQYSEVQQTTFQSSETIYDGRGATSTRGMAVGSHGFTKSFTEHGYVIGLVNVRGDITYQQGIDRDWTKSTRYDIYWPALSQIGEQSVRDDEIYYVSGAGATVFGYQERYAEYRYKQSRITGDFNSDASGNIDEFHLAEEFTSAPSLDSTFIESNTRTPLDRALSVPSEPQFSLDAFFDMKCARPMPLYGVPGNLDHF